VALKINTSYILVFKIDEKNLTYTCKILELDDDGFITLLDKFNRTKSYHKRFLIEYEEIENSIFEEKLNESGSNGYR